MSKPKIVQPMTVEHATAVKNTLIGILKCNCSMEEAMVIIGFIYADLNRGLNLPAETDQEVINRFNMVLELEQPIEVDARPVAQA